MPRAHLGDDRRRSVSAQPGHPAPECLDPIGIARQVDIGLAVTSEQVVVESTDGTGWVLVAHGPGHRCAVDLTQVLAQLVQRRDSELEEQGGDPP